MIEPIVLGGGKGIFPDDGAARPFKLVSAVTAKTGVQVNRYERARLPVDLGRRGGGGLVTTTAAERHPDQPRHEPDRRKRDRVADEHDHAADHVERATGRLVPRLRRASTARAPARG